MNMLKLIWYLYPFAYEFMKNFGPYQKMLEDLIEIANPQTNERYLDVGCGTSNLFEMMIKKIPVSFKLYGLDISLPALKISSRKVEGIFILHDVFNGLPFPSEYFDKVFSIHLLNYLSSRIIPTFLNEVRRVLKKNGEFILTVLKKPISFREAIPYFKCTVRKKKIRSIILIPSYILVGIMNLPIKMNREILYYSENSIMNLMEDSQFRVEKIKETYYANHSLLIKAVKF